MSIYIGTVVGTAMQKTAKVEVTRMFLHPHVLKYIRHRKVVFADNRDECVVGDVVLIKSCPRISNKKHYKIQEVVARIPRVTPTATTTEGELPLVKSEVSMAAGGESGSSEAVSEV